MRFTLHPTNDGSLTVFDRDAGECFKSRHAARTEVEHVFYAPGILAHPAYGEAKPFRVLELGLGLGTNFLHCLKRGFQGEYVSVERDLCGLRFFLDHEPQEELESFVKYGKLERSGFHARLMEESFSTALDSLAQQGYRAHAIFFDPFSPKANPECWTPEFFRQAAGLLTPGGRLVTYSVCRQAKDSALAAGLLVEKHKLPANLKKRSALLATRPFP